MGLFMRSLTFSRFVALVSLLLLPSLVFAHGFKLGSLEIGHPWTRATPNGADVAGGFFKITNNGTEEDRLVSVSVDGLSRVEIHEMKTENGVMSMRPLKDGLPIPAGATVELKPGSFHVMMFGLTQPFVEGTMVKGKITFEKAGSADIEFKVEAVGANPAEKHQHGTTTTTN
jgi:copper(I)-binding protein